MQDYHITWVVAMLGSVLANGGVLATSLRLIILLGSMASPKKTKNLISVYRSGSPIPANVAEKILIFINGNVRRILDSGDGGNCPLGGMNLSLCKLISSLNQSQALKLKN